MVRHSIAWLVMIGELWIWWFPCGEPGTEKAMGATISWHFNPQEKYLNILAENKYLRILSPSFRDDSAPRDSSGGPSGLWFVCWIYALLIDWSTYLLTNHNCVSLLQVGSVGRPQLTFQAPPPRPAGQRQRKKMVSFSFIKTQLQYYIICIYTQAQWCTRSVTGLSSAKRESWPMATSARPVIARKKGWRSAVVVVELHPY
jgi:hypothetical protein